MRGQRVLTIAARWSLTLAPVITAGAFPLSHWYELDVTRYVAVSNPDGSEGMAPICSIEVSAGEVILATNSETPGLVGPRRIQWMFYRDDKFYWRWWFHHRAGPRVNTYGAPILNYYGAPVWALIAVSAVPASMLWFGDIRANRRRSKGLCPSCHYDRRGLTPNAPCPECGNLPATPTPPSSPH